MDPARWKRVDNLLKSAISRPPRERDAYIASECAEDEELEREVRSLRAMPISSGTRLGPYETCTATARPRPFQSGALVASLDESTFSIGLGRQEQPYKSQTHIFELSAPRRE
jgi:hypothetical protein